MAYYAKPSAGSAVVSCRRATPTSADFAGPRHLRDKLGPFQAGALIYTGASASFGSCGWARFGIESFRVLRESW